MKKGIDKAVEAIVETLGEHGVGILALKHWDKINQVNELINAYCEKTENLYFINTVPTYLDADGQPKPEWFFSDQLHLNTKGYEVWNGLIKHEIEHIMALN